MQQWLKENFIVRYKNGGETQNAIIGEKNYQMKIFYLREMLSLTSIRPQSKWLTKPLNETIN